MTFKRIPRIGIGGPVGSGKTMLIEQFVPLLSQKGYKTAIVSNDVVSREDASMNLSVVEEIESTHNQELDLIIIESGGDNITTTFSPALADYFIYIIDVAGGDKYPRKRGLGIENCELLVINKIDLAPHVGADLKIMERDAKLIRKGKPFVFVNCKTGEGIKEVAEHIVKDVLFDLPPKTSIEQLT